MKESVMRFIKKYLFIVLGLLVAVLSIFGFNRFYEMPKMSYQSSQIDNLVSNKTLSNTIQYKQKTNFLLSLSWSPTYCLEQDPRGKTPQCQINKPKKYRFIVHGLWPQPITDTGGKHLNYCRDVSVKLEASIVKNYFYLMPSSGLMLHQWRKHASCGNFTQKIYFKTIENMYEQFKIGNLLHDITATTNYDLKMIIQKITSHIPNITTDNIVIACRNNQLSEVRVCLNNDYTVRKCYYSEIKSGRCSKDSIITVPF